LVQDVCELTGTIDLELLRCSFPRDGEVSWEVATSIDVGEFLRKDRQRGFEFDSGALMRITMLRTAEHTCTIIWTTHHALIDGRSMTLVWKQWLSVYDALLQGEEIPPVSEIGSVEPPLQDES